MAIATKIPGFTAESALFKTNRRSRFVQSYDSNSNSVYIQPAMLNLCDVLRDMAWNAYDAHNYALVEIVDTMMEGAGCFR